MDRNIDKDVMAKPGCRLDPIIKLLLDMAANDFWEYSGRFMIGFTALLGYQSFPSPSSLHDCEAVGGGIKCPGSDVPVDAVEGDWLMLNV